MKSQANEKENEITENIAEITFDYRYPLIFSSISNEATSSFNIIKETPIDRYYFSKPKFFSLIEREYNQNLKEIDSRPSLDRIQTLQILRSILDSKYNEYLFYSTTKAISDFPEFVYGWLHNFYVDEFDHHVKIIGQNDIIDPKMRKLSFYH